jgi:hypothetical protein
LRLYLPPAFMLVSCAAYSLTLKMEALCSSETLVDFQRTTQRYIPEDSTLQYFSLPKTSFKTCNCSRSVCVQLVTRQAMITMRSCICI